MLPMAQLIRIGNRSEMPEDGEAKEFKVGAKVICVANVDGRLSAMDNVCLHRGGPLAEGVVMDGKVICPWHGWRWDPANGSALESDELKLQVYPIKLEGEDVLIEM
jgi:nitrite reductase (NADH) small subunit